MSELWQLSALGLAEKIRTKQTSSREVHLRCLTVAPKIEALVGSITPIDPTLT